MSLLRTPRRRRPASVIVVALSAAAGLVLAACGSDHVTPGRTVTRTVVAPGDGSNTDGGLIGSSSAQGTAGTSSTSSTSTSTHSKPPKPKGLPVQVSSAVIGDGSQVGVGMPIILLLSRQLKDAHAFASATKVTVNGKIVHGGWFFERKYVDPGHPVEADYRLQSYWPAHASIHMDLPVKGVSAGKGLVFANNLTLDFSTGAAHILTVDNSTHRLTVVSDGKVWGKFPVSLGYPNTPTRRGVKVIMEKGKDISMRGPGYFDAHVKFTQRLTYDGEYLHAAPWNCTGSPGCVGPQNNIGHANSSNGCTNLTPTDAEKLYNFTEVGDVVKYMNADGPLMQLGDGYGDWNVPWPQWKTGGLYSLL